jgi:nitrous oxide reductase
MTEKKAKLSRRNFLLTVGVSSAAATAAAIVAKTPDGASQAASKDKRATQGYQASEHVNNYYRTTKVV